MRIVVETIASDPPFLIRPTDFDLQQLQLDLDFVHHKRNLSVKHLILWRHKSSRIDDAGQAYRGWSPERV